MIFPFFPKFWIHPQLVLRVPIAQVDYLQQLPQYFFTLSTFLYIHTSVCQIAYESLSNLVLRVSRIQVYQNKFEKIKIESYEFKSSKFAKINTYSLNKAFLPLILWILWVFCKSVNIKFVNWINSCFKNPTQTSLKYCENVVRGWLDFLDHEQNHFFSP